MELDATTEYANDFLQFMDENPTVFHFVSGVARLLSSAGYIEIVERDPPKLVRGGKYYITRNLSSIIAFEIGKDFVAGDDGFAIVAGHIDANRLRLKPSSLVENTQGFLRLGTAIYGGPSLSSWWDRDLGLGGRVLKRSSNRGGVTSNIIRLPGVIGSIPSLAPHFGTISSLSKANLEENFVPILATGVGAQKNKYLERELSAPLAQKHPIELLRLIAEAASCEVADLIDVELELFSAETPIIGGLNKDLLYCGRLDDRLCSYTAIRGLIDSACSTSENSHSVKIVACYDNEEIGSLSWTGGYNKFMESVISLIHQSFFATKDERMQSMANSITLSADVTHAVNPNYINAYSEGHMPLLNTGMAVKQLGRFTSTAIDAVICAQISEHAGTTLQTFAPRSDTASGSTIGPMRAASLGCRTIDVGIPILSMHSIREITGASDIELGIRWFRSFFELSDRFTHFDYVDVS